jgi:hypothetical protein
VVRRLSAEERRQFEEFLSQVDAGTLPIAPSMREHVEAAVKIARLTLRASGDDGAQADLDQLAARIEAAPELPPWAGGWNEASEWTDDRVPRTPHEHRHQRASEEGKKVARGWISHPAVAREVVAAKAELSALAEPFWMYDQKAVTFITAGLLGATAILPDGAEWPDPFAGAPTWLRNTVERIGPEFVGSLRALAFRIAEAGAPLDPEDLGGWLVLAQLALLPVDLGREPAEIVDDLNTWPPGWIDRDAAGLGHVATHTSRHGRTARFQADLAAVAEVVAQRLGPPAIAAPYAGGLRRQMPSIERARDARRKALRAVLVVHPNVSAGKLIATWVAGPATPGGQLRTRLRRQPHDRPPGESTLRADLRELRR